MIIGTAGHIDHGKTRLVQALTGIDTDRLPEEKRRGITIDLGFAYTPLPSGAVLGFVDVPGHERLVHTMIAGAASIEFFLLVVAADDGVMPQTVEHLQILDLLGIREGLVVLTKEDLVDSERLKRAKEEVRSALGGTGPANVDILTVSARTGRGIDVLLDRLKAEAETRPERVNRGAFRLAVDRAFSLPGAGTIATGTVVSGTVAAGDRLVVVPGDLEARVRSVHAQGQAAPMASAGQRCALNLRGPGVTKDRIHRGDCLVDPALARVSDRFDAQVRLLRSEGRPLGQWNPVYLHLGTTAITARVVPLRERPLNPGESGFVQIVPQQALLACNGDRFILRDIGATRTIAGGIVLDPRPPVRRRRTPERLAVLRALEPRAPSAALLGLLALPPGYVDLGAFAADWSLTHSEVDGFAREIQAHVVEGNGTRYALGTGVMERVHDAVAGQLAWFHQHHPELPGIAESQLHRSAALRWCAPLLGTAMPGLLAGGRVEKHGSWVRLREHSSALAAPEARLWDRIRPLIAAQPYRPPSVHALADQLALPVARVRAVCKALVRMAELVEIGTDRFFLISTVDEMARIAAQLYEAKARQLFTVVEFKDRVGSGRNVAIDVLEYFDRRGLTRRVGDARYVVGRALDVETR